MSLSDSIDEFLNRVDDLTFVSSIRGLTQPVADCAPERDFKSEFESMSKGLESKYAKQYVETNEPENFTAQAVYKFLCKFTRELNVKVKMFVPDELLPSIKASAEKSE